MLLAAPDGDCNGVTDEWKQRIFVWDEWKELNIECTFSTTVKTVDYQLFSLVCFINQVLEFGHAEGALHALGSVEMKQLRHRAGCGGRWCSGQLEGQP